MAATYIRKSQLLNPKRSLHESALARHLNAIDCKAFVPCSCPTLASVLSVMHTQSTFVSNSANSGGALYLTGVGNTVSQVGRPACVGHVTHVHVTSVCINPAQGHMMLCSTMMC